MRMLILSTSIYLSVAIYILLPMIEPFFSYFVASILSFAFVKEIVL